MALIEWKKSLSVGIGAMDAQHQKLVGLINQLADAMMAGKGITITGAVLSDLVEYTKTHFASEERLLQTNKYPEYSAQKTEHEAFVRKVLDFQSQFNRGQITLSLELMNFMRDWLLNHIQGRDKQYGAYLNGKGIS